MSADTVDDARLWAFVMMEASGLTVGQMWLALAPYLSRRDAQRRRPTWSAVHERLTDLLLCAATEPEADPQRVILIFQGGLACRALAA